MKLDPVFQSLHGGMGDTEGRVIFLAQSRGFLISESHGVSKFLPLEKL